MLVLKVVRHIQQVPKLTVLSESIATLPLPLLLFHSAHLGLLSSWDFQSPPVASQIILKLG